VLGANTGAIRRVCLYKIIILYRQTLLIAPIVWVGGYFFRKVQKLDGYIIKESYNDAFTILLWRLNVKKN